MRVAYDVPFTLMGNVKPNGTAGHHFEHWQSFRRATLPSGGLHLGRTDDDVRTYLRLAPTCTEGETCSSRRAQQFDPPDSDHGTRDPEQWIRPLMTCFDSLLPHRFERLRYSGCAIGLPTGILAQQHCLSGLGTVTPYLDSRPCCAHRTGVICSDAVTVDRHIPARSLRHHRSGSRRSAPIIVLIQQVNVSRR